MNNNLDPEQFVRDALAAGCPADQVQNLIRAGTLLQPRQLVACSAARLCDSPAGPTAIGFGGARGGGKSHWLLVQMGSDDCQRRPGLKCLLLRKTNKSNKENLEDLRKRLFANLPHNYNATSGILTFQNGSTILARHYQHEKEIDSFLGLEYDVIGIEEATTLTPRKWEDIKTCNRTSKPDWRPRIYSTTNPGGVGHQWYFETFIVPFERGTETKTRFIPARVEDNKFTNPEYKDILESQTGWRRRSWLDGAWDVAAGQFFNTFRYDTHVIPDFANWRGNEWFAAMDYGFTHYTVILLGCFDAEGNLYIIDEHAERGWVPQRHISAFLEMLARHQVALGSTPALSAYSRRFLSHFVAGGDLFARQYDGNTVAALFRERRIHVRPANTNRVQGWAEILVRLGDPDRNIKPTLFIHERCRRLIECLPYLQHDPDLPADVLKTNTNEEGLGGDDPADALRYLVATRVPRIHQVKLRGL